MTRLQREKVERRANGCCEYCHAPQGICAYTFHVEHIIPRSKQGSDALTNYALACFSCNNAKGAHLTGVDPETGAEVGLFHPRKHSWAEHFRWAKRSTQIEGISATGRATIERLKMNGAFQRAARALWVKTGIWP